MGKALSDMTLEELWELFPIILTEHKDIWDKWYAEEEKRLAGILPPEHIKISHIGSTAIRNIWAKQIEVCGGKMEYDCGFRKGNNWFRYRTGGIIIHKNKMLFVKSSVGDYHYMIGGGVHLGETSEKCIEREIFEESGITAHADHLAIVCENFFKGADGKVDGLDCHTIEFYYYMIISDDSGICKDMTDEGEKLVWIPIEKIQQSNIKPDCIKEHIHEVINKNKTIHIIEERDR